MHNLPLARFQRTSGFLVQRSVYRCCPVAWKADLTFPLNEGLVWSWYSTKSGHCANVFQVNHDILLILKKCLESLLRSLFSLNLTKVKIMISISFPRRFFKISKMSLINLETRLLCELQTNFSDFVEYQLQT